MLPGEELQGADSASSVQCASKRACDEGRCCLRPSHEEAKRCRRKSDDRDVVQSSQHLPEDCLSSSSHFVMVLGIEPQRC